MCSPIHVSPLSVLMNDSVIMFGQESIQQCQFVDLKTKLGEYAQIVSQEYKLAVVGHSTSPLS